MSGVSMSNGQTGPRSRAATRAALEVMLTEAASSPPEVADWEPRGTNVTAS
ncbi:MAG: hypothetical protein WBP81_06250 [Solirubrobacteraceae bacterium]